MPAASVLVPRSLHAAPDLAVDIAWAKRQVPFLKPGDSEAVRSELEMQSRDLEDAPEPEPVAGFLNLPVAGSLGGERTSSGKQALSKAAEDVREHGGAGPKGFGLGLLKQAPFWRGKEAPSDSGKQAAAEAEGGGQSTAQEGGIGLAILKHAPFGIGKEAAEKAEAREAEQEAEESRGLSLGMLKKGLFGDDGAQNGQGSANDAESTEQQAEQAGFSMDLNKLWPFNNNDGNDGGAVEKEAEKQAVVSKEKSGFLGLGQ